VYGICELLLFYAIKIKGDPIGLSPDQVNKGRVLDLIRFLDRDKDGWMDCNVLSLFGQYLEKCNDINLEQLSFEINKNDNRKFKLKKE
jgi:hypothetical protein